MDRETLPRWGWLLAGLLLASLLGNLLNVLVLFELGLPEEYQVVTIIASMAPVLIYVGVWYDEDRRGYWDRSRAGILGDVSFVVIGAALGASIASLAIDGIGIPRIVTDLVAMVGGFTLAWGLFWWRNPEIYSGEDG